MCPIIQEGESLSSLITRLACRYNLQLINLNKSKFSYDKLDEIDLYSEASIIDVISNGFGIYSQRLIKATFFYYMDRLPAFTHQLIYRPNSEYVSKIPNRDPIRKTGIFASSHFKIRFFTRYSFGGYYERNRNTLRYCPICLSSDKNPYFRLFWRLSYYSTCLKHQVLLIDKCPQCESLIRLDLQIKIDQCFKCQEKLYKAKIIEIDITNYIKLHKIFISKLFSKHLSSTEFLEALWTIYSKGIIKKKFYDKVKEKHGLNAPSLLLKFNAMNDLLEIMFNKKCLSIHSINDIRDQWRSIYD